MSQCRYLDIFLSQFIPVSLTLTLVEGHSGNHSNIKALQIGKRLVIGLE